MFVFKRYGFHPPRSCAKAHALRLEATFHLPPCSPLVSLSLPHPPPPPLGVLGGLVMLMCSHAERVQFGRTFVFTPFPVSPLGQSPPPTLFIWSNLVRIRWHLPCPRAPWLQRMGVAAKLLHPSAARAPVLWRVKITPLIFAYVAKNHYLSIAKQRAKEHPYNNSSELFVPMLNFKIIDLWQS